MVDAQPKIALETVHSVIPPGITFLGLGKQAKAIDETEIYKASQRRAFRFGAKHLAFPRFRIMYITIFRRNVVIAEQGNVTMGSNLGLHVAGKRVQPLQFVLVFVRVQALSVGNVDTDHPQSLNGRGDHALLYVFASWHGLKYFFRP